jgi:hypothetical protein
MTANIYGTAYSATQTVEGGKITPAIYEDGYYTPYPIKFAGLLLKTASSRTYDADAPTFPVAIPCTNGGRPDGFAFTPTKDTTMYGNQSLLAAADIYLPLVADRTGGGTTYTEDYLKFPVTTCHPLIPGRVIGVPVAASTAFVIGDAVASAANGFAEPATTGDIVIGKAEYAANNSAGAAGAINVWVKVGHQYTSA